MKSRTLYLFLCLVVASSFMVVSCSPKPAPTSGITPVPPPVSVTPVPSSGETEWSKVLAAAKSEGKVTSYSGKLTGDMGRSVTKAFEEKYGIKLELLTGSGAQLIERLKSESAAGKSIADTVDGSVTQMAVAKSSNLTTTWGDLPVLREDVFRYPPKSDPEGHILGIAGGINFGWVNTNLVPVGQEPRSYRDLLEPRWKGKVGLPSPTTAAAITSLYLVMKKSGHLDDAYWRQLGQTGLKIVPNNEQLKLWIMKGDVSVVPSLPDQLLTSAIVQGAPLRAIALEEGTLVFQALESFVLAKNGPHPNAARVFVNWLLSKEGQTVYAAGVGGLPVMRKDVPDSRPAAAWVDIKTVHLVDLPLQLESAKVMGDGTMAQLLGVAK